MSISRCASLVGLAAIVALAILTNVSSLFEYKTKVQVKNKIQKTKVQVTDKIQKTKDKSAGLLTMKT